MLCELFPTEAMMLPTICIIAYKSQPPICNDQYSLFLFTDRLRFKISG
jgi:hypothetical protein